MKLHTLIKISGLAASLSLAAIAGRADTIVDTGAGPNDANTAWYLGPVGNNPFDQNLAGKFTLSGATTITDVEGWMLAFTDGDVAISIASNGGLTPGAAIYTTMINVLAADGIGWHGASGLSWNLAAGDYWVVFAGGGAGFTGAMPYYSPNQLGVEAFTSVGDGNWYNYDGLGIGVKIQGNTGDTRSVPDQASSLVLFGVALAGLVALRRRLN